MKILTAIINSIWNTVTFMDKEQRALVAHVLTVSQAHPKSFSYDNQHGTWQSKGLKITFWERHGTVELSNVKYEASWRSVAILKKHFAMLHICLHHEHIGKALSDIDKAENEPEKKVNTYDNQQAVGDLPIEKLVTANIGSKFNMAKPTDGFATNVVEVAPEPIDLAKYVGKNCYVEMSNGDKGNCYVNYLQAEDAVLLLDSQLLFNRYGKHVYGYDLHVTLIRDLEGSFRDCIKADDVIKPVDNFEDLDLTKYIGKRIKVKFKNGQCAIGYAVATIEQDTLVYFNCRGYNRRGVHLQGHDGDFNVVSVELVSASEWVTEIDLTQWLGKTVDVKLRNGAPINNILVSAKQNGVVYHVDLGCMPYTKHGSYWHYQLDDRDIVAIKIST